MTSKPGPQPGVYLWRGREYVGMRAVARAAGVHHRSISYHLRVHGHLDRLGAGQKRKAPQSAARGVVAHGRAWPSRAALARDLGVSGPTISRWLAHHPDRLLAALMAADARKTAAAMREAQMIDTIRKDAA